MKPLGNEELKKKLQYTYYEMQCTKSEKRKKDLQRHASKIERMLRYEKNVSTQ